MSTVRIMSKEIISYNMLRIEVGTNCPQGGDSGHGGRTILRFINQASTDMRVRVDTEESKSCDMVELVFGGDSECVTLLEALQFACDVLGQHMEDIP